ncbi:MAG TPA: class I SAM-dependent methyltransferase [Candidatus Acidoferrales bacterium]|nr:class I SAM-dependent methyltransferase [Candidatus Acidoferrales bacterium]
MSDITATKSTGEHALPRLADMHHSAELLRHYKSKWEYYWRREPEGYRCKDTAQFIRDNNFSEHLVVELGCGDRGLDAKGALGERYVGVDVSRTALKNAKKVDPRANFINADMRMLPFRDDIVDVLISFETMHILGYEVHAAVKEIGRVTKGLAIFELSDRRAVPEDFAMNRVKGQISMAIEMDCCLAMVPKNKDEREYMSLYFTADSAKSLAEGAGFKKVVTRQIEVASRRLDTVPMIEVFAAKQDDMIEVV